MSGARARSGWSYYRLEPEWARRVVTAARVRPGDTVLDLGAGSGALSAPLLDAGARVIALEKHAGRARRLRSRFPDADLVVVEADMRELRLPARPFRVVSNPPFDLVRPLVRQLLGSRLLVGADIVVQRDTARRLAGSQRQSRYVVEIGEHVPRRAFEPRPRVDAAVLRVRRG